MSAPILHGRRKGDSRYTPELKMQGRGLSAHGAQRTMPTAEDLKNTTVLSKADWDRIQYQLNKRAIEGDKIRKAREEQERLHESSKERVKNWSNTIAGQRQRKLEARRIREEKEEEEKKQIDIEEAQYKGALRKEAIEKAKTQQYYQTDRVKGFHGALLLTEVLKERDAQLELKRLQKTANTGNDQQWLEMARKDYEEAILKDQEDARYRIRNTRQCAQFQKAQINTHLKSKEKEQQEEDVEGEELHRLAAHYEMEKKRLDEIRNAEARTLMSDNLKQIDDVHRMRNIHQQQEEDEDEECRIFAAAKRKMMKLRAEKEQELHNEKQTNLEKIREKLHAQMQQKVDDEDNRITRAAEEGEAKRAAEEAKKEASNRKMLQSIAVHRHEQMREQERQGQDKRKRELDMLAVRREADELFARNEEEKGSRKYQEATGLQAFHQQQIDNRKHHAQRSREEQLNQDQGNAELINLEEAQFQEYARRVIHHCEKGGRNTHPLRKAAQEGAGGGLGPVFPGKGGVRPSYMVSDQTGVQMPSYKRDTTDDTKKSIYGNGQTDKRLGFVW